MKGKTGRMDKRYQQVYTIHRDIIAPQTAGIKINIGIGIKTISHQDQINTQMLNHQKLLKNYHELNSKCFLENMRKKLILRHFMNLAPY